MQSNSFQRAILSTILYFTLFCAIAAGCDWCKGSSVNKSTSITITPTLPVIPEVKVTPKETDPDNSAKKPLDATGKEEEEDKEKEREEEEEAAIKEILQERENQLETKILDNDSLQEESNNPPVPAPSAPPAPLDDKALVDSPYNDDPPPPYSYEEENKNCLDNNAPKNSTRVQSKKVTEKIKEKYKEILDKINVAWLTKTYNKYSPHELIKELNTLENKRDINKNLLVIRNRKDEGLSEADEELLEEYKWRTDEKVVLKIKKLRFRIVILKNVMKDKKKNESTNQQKELYPRQQYAPGPDYSSNNPTNPGPSAPPSYSLINPSPSAPSYSSSNATIPNVYPSLDEYKDPIKQSLQAKNYKLPLAAAEAPHLLLK